MSFLGSALLLRRIPVTETPPPPRQTSTLGLVREGLVLVLRHPVLRAALGCTSTVNFFTFIAGALLVLYASRELGLSAGAIGIALGFGALGGFAGAALAPRVSRAIGLGRTAMIGAVLFPAPLALTALVSGPTWTKVAMLAAIELVSSVGVMLMDVNLNALLTAVTPDDALDAGRGVQRRQLRHPTARRAGRRRVGHHHRAAAHPGHRRPGWRARRAVAARVPGAPHPDLDDAR